MHIAFIPYGLEDKVNIFLRDVQAQKCLIPFKTKEGKEEKVWMQCQLRRLPFGVYEFIFPKEYLDTALTSFRCDKQTAYVKDYPLMRAGLKTIRKVLGLKEFPKKFSTDNKFLWLSEDVSLIPIGYKEDRDIIDPINGSTHEGI